MAFRDDPVPAATRLWTTWLGAPGTRPVPLDAFLRRALRGQRGGGELTSWVRATAAWAVTALCAVEGVAPEDLPDPPGALLDRLRSADGDAMVRVAGALAGLDRLPRSARRRTERALADLEARADLRGRLVRHGIPPGWAPYLGPRLQGWGPQRAEAWLAAQCRRPPLWCRAGREGSLEAAAERLRKEGFTVREAHGALAVSGPRSIRASQAYREGWVEVQDLASQAVAPLLEVRPGMRVWDACAGQGGKTVQLAAALGGRGVLWATDTDDGALAVLKQRLRRTGWAGNVRLRSWEGAEPPRWGREGRGGPDRILVDVPCGSSGTWRRNPDARLRPPQGDPARWAGTQRHLLSLALDVARPGARVVYATCSVLPAEDEAVVAAAVDGRPGWTVLQQGLHGCPDQDADTLFAAVLVRS